MPENCKPRFGERERRGVTPAPRELLPPARLNRPRRVLNARKGSDLVDLMEMKLGCRRILAGGAVDERKGGKMKRLASGLLRLSIAFCTDAPTSTRLMASAIEAEAGDSGGDEKKGIEAIVAGVEGSVLTIREATMSAPFSSAMMVENLNPVLLDVPGVGKNNSLGGLILVFNSGGGIRRLPVIGPGDDAVLLIPDVVSMVRFKRAGIGDAVRLRSKGETGMFL